MRLLNGNSCRSLLRSAVLFLAVCFCFISEAQDLPPAPAYNSIGLKIHLDSSIQDDTFKDDLQSFLYQEHIGLINQDAGSSDLELSFDGQVYNIYRLPEKRIVYRIDNSKPEKTFGVLTEKIQQFAYGFYIKNLQLRNKAYEFSFQLKPVVYKNEDVFEALPEDKISTTKGILNFNTSNSAAILEVTNHSDNPLYFSIIEINSRGEIQGLIPNINCPLIGSERLIKPKKTVSFKVCYFQFGPPFETLTLKGFASSEPINFTPLINNTKNQSQEYIKNFYSEMYTFEFKYNIVDEAGRMPYVAPLDTYKPKSSTDLEAALSELPVIEAKYGKTNSRYIDQLKEIGQMHFDLGNKEESETYFKLYQTENYNREQAQRSEEQARKAASSSSKKEREKREKEIATYTALSDSKKIEYLEGVINKRDDEILELNRQVQQLKAEIDYLKSVPINRTQMRGAQATPIKESPLVHYTYRALIIAEQDYRDESISDLKFPLGDALSLKDVLTSNYSFDTSNVKFLQNPTRREIFTALDQLFRISTEKDHLLIFYAGHGVYDEDFKRGYWLPSDAESGSKSTWMSNLDIKDYISNIKTKHTLLISDACFSGSIFEYNRDVNTDPALKAVEKLLKKNARNAMTSGLDRPVPDESVFIKYLLKALVENNAPYLKSSDLFKTISDAVLNNTDNIPQYGVIRNANHEGGEFIFLKSNN